MPDTGGTAPSWLLPASGWSVSGGGGRWEQQRVFAPSTDARRQHSPPPLALQIGDYDAAVHDLLRGGETDLGYAVAVMASAGNKELAVHRMAARCEGLGLLKEALHLLQGSRNSSKLVRQRLGRRRCVGGWPHGGARASSPPRSSHRVVPVAGLLLCLVLRGLSCAIRFERIALWRKRARLPVVIRPPARPSPLSLQHHRLR